MKKHLLSAKRFLSQAAMLVSGLLVANSIYSQNVNIDQGGTVTQCSGNFYDSGGSGGSYSNGENESILFQAGYYGGQVRLTFSSFQLETCCDYLGIYDGQNTNGTQLYYGNGSNSPGTVTSTTGYLFVTFTSDGSVTYSGWAAAISCVGTPIDDEASLTGFDNMAACGNSRFPITIEGINGGLNTIDSFEVNYSINGGTTVTEMVNDSFQTAESFSHTFSQLADLSAPGTYDVLAWIALPNDTVTFNDTLMYSINQNAPEVNVYDTAVCGTGTEVTLTASGGANYVWYGGEVGGNYIDTVAEIDVTISSDTNFLVYFSDTGFYVSDLTDTGNIVDHNGLTGDDRGGIAVTEDYVYFNGDSYCARYDALGLTNGVSFQRRDGIFSDLETGQLYTLFNTTSGVPVGSSIGLYTVDAICLMDVDLSLGDTIILSQSFAAGGAYGNTSQAGIYAGRGYVIVYTGTQGNNFYKIDVPSGNVTLINTFTFDSKRGNENWAHWGFATYENGAYYVNYRENGTNDIDKLNLTDQSETTIYTYTNLSDMASITYSPWLDRMYFHHESSSQFGSGSEMGGYVGGESTLGIGPGAGCPSTVFVDIANPMVNLGADTSFCDGNTVTLDAGSYDGYVWSDASTMSTLDVSTTGNVSVTVTDENGCNAEDTVIITVNELPAVELGSDTGICEGNDLTLMGPTGMSTYAWSDSSTSSDLIVNASGTYTLTVSDGQCENSDEITVTFNANPVVDLGADIDTWEGQQITLDAGSGFASYLWSTTETTQTITITAVSSTIVSVEVTDDNGCSGTDEVAINVSVGVNDVDGEHVALYPNPTTGVINIQTSESFANGSIEIVDVRGSVVERFSLNANKAMMDVSFLDNGVYYMNIEADGVVSTHKLVIQK